MIPSYNNYFFNNVTLYLFSPVFLALSIHKIKYFTDKLFRLRAKKLSLPDRLRKKQYNFTIYIYIQSYSIIDIIILWIVCEPLKNGSEGPGVDKKKEEEERRRGGRRSRSSVTRPDSTKVRINRRG